MREPTHSSGGSGQAPVSLASTILSRLADVGLGRIILTAASRLSSTVISFVMLWGLTFILTPEYYDLFLYTFALAVGIGFLGTLGQPYVVVKHVGEAAKANNAAILKFSVILLLLGQVLLFSGAAIAAAIPGEKEKVYEMIPAIAVFGAIYGLSEFMAAYFRSQMRMGMALIPRENIWRVAICVTILVIYNSAWRPTAGTFLLVTTGLLVIVVAYQLIAFFRSEGYRWLSAKLSARRDLLGLSRESVYFFLVQVAIAGENYITTFLVGVLVGIDAAAAYYIAYRISLLLILPGMVSETIGGPMIAARLKQNDRHSAQQLLGFFSLFSFSAALCGFVFIWFFGSAVLSLFGEGPPAMFTVLIILCVGSLTTAFIGLSQQFLLLVGGERPYLQARLTLFAVYVGLIFVMGTAMGVVGIALARLMFMAATNGFQIVWCARMRRYDLTAASLLRPGRARADGATS